MLALGGSLFLGACSGRFSESFVVGANSTTVGSGGNASSPGSGGAASGSGSGGTVSGSGSGGTVSSTGSGGTATGGGSGGTVSSTGTGGAGAGGGTSTCGNGSVEANESCDGSNLSGGSCTMLGFQSGTLSCSASCRYDTRSCSGALTVTVVPSRTSCVAPCSVFFDATSTAGLQSGDYVLSNFTWDFDSTRVDPNGAHPHTVGFVTGHVFEIPGTYQVAVRVRDAAGHAGTTTVPITVGAMTGPTIYVAATGNDKNAGTSMSAPLATPKAALQKAAAQTSILFRRGDTFSLGSTSLTLSTQGPWLVGAYTDPASSSTAAPILSSTGSGTVVMIAGAKDTRLVDLHFKTPGAAIVFTVGNSPDTLIERLEIEGQGYVDGSSQTVGQAFYTDNTSSPVFFVDSNIHDFLGYGLYGNNVSRFAFIGNTVQRFGGGDHGVRLAGGNLSYLAENTIVSNDTKSAMSAITIRGDNQKIVVTGNHVNRIIEFTPQNTSSVEHISDALAEGNLINDSRTTGFYQYSMGISGKHIVARNNIFVNSPTAVLVAGQPQLPLNFVDQIYLYNNTSYFFPTTYPDEYGCSFAMQNTTSGSLVVQNNIFAESLTVQTLLVQADKKGTLTQDHNLTFAPKVSSKLTPATGDLVGDPGFTSTNAAADGVFRPSAGSPAVDKGTSVPVYGDFTGALRASGAGWDIGAYELQQ